MTIYTPLSQRSINDPKVIYVDSDIVYKANDKEIHDMAKKLEDDITLRAAKAISYKNQQGDIRYVVKDKALNKAQGIDADYIDLSADDFLIWNHYQDA